MRDRLLGIAGLATFLVAALFFFSLARCNLYAILVANQADPPPNTFQFAKGWECTCEVWQEHYLPSFD